jgi:hypothetical protein
MLGIRDIDLGGQRHDHRTGQALLVTHRVLILGVREAGYRRGLALRGRLLDHPDQPTARQPPKRLNERRCSLGMRVAAPACWAGIALLLARDRRS